MKFRGPKWQLVFGLCVVGAAGCAADDNSGQVQNGITSVTCSPGQMQMCLCPGGVVSAQTCSPDGRSFSACMCGDAPGAAGMAAAAGGPGGITGPGQPNTSGSAGMMSSMSNMGGGPAPAPGGSGAAGMMAAGGRGGGTAPVGGMGGISGGAGTTGSGDDVPATEHCAPVADWDPAWVEFEEEVLRLVNINRAMGWNCDTQGQFAAAPPLTMNASLRCSARLHSEDMAMRMYFDHNNPDGDGPGERIGATGYKGSTWGENIAKGQQTPAQVVMGWMDSDGHCANIMRPQFTEIGVGFYRGAGRGDLLWTQNFGAPCTGRFCL